MLFFYILTIRLELAIYMGFICTEIFLHAAWTKFVKGNRFQSSVLKYGMLPPIDTEYRGKGISNIIKIK